MTFPPGYRPDPWGTSGDHERRLRALEAVPDDDESVVTATGGDVPSVILATSSLRGYWRMGDAASPLVDSYGGIDPQDLTGSAGTTGTFGVTGALIPAYDDGAFQFGYNQSSLSPPGGTGAAAWSVTDNTSPKFAFAGTTSFSVEAWIKPTSGWTMPATGFGLIAGTATTAGLSLAADFTGWGLILMNNYAVQFRRATTAPSNTTVASSALVPGSWYHVVGTYDGTTMRLYINGTLVASAASALSVTSVTTFKVGAGTSFQSSSTQSRFFYGVIDEVAIYNAALTAVEVAIHYQTAGVGGIPASGADGYVLTTYGGATYWAPSTIEVTY